MKESSPLLFPDIVQTNTLAIHEQNVPTVLRDTRGRVRWKLPENTPEQNEQIGIRNVQLLFLEKFPEFNDLFPRGKDGKIAENKMEEAKRFISDRLGNARKFTKSIGNVPLRKTAPYFEGSHIVTTQKSFQPWSIEFGESIEKQRRKTNPNYSTLKHSSPQEIIVEIERSVRKFILDGNMLTQRNLRNKGMGWLVKAIERYYPEHLSGLKRKLLTDERKDNEKGRRSKYSWTPEIIRDETIKIYHTQGRISHDFLASIKRKDLSRAIERWYPGGITQLKTDINATGDDDTIKNSTSKNKRGYWTQETIEKEALEFYQATGGLSGGLLYRQNRWDLRYAIQQRYPRGINGLREKLGIESSRPEDTISPDEANEELLKFLEARD